MKNFVAIILLRSVVLRRKIEITLNLISLARRKKMKKLILKFERSLRKNRKKSFEISVLDKTRIY